MPGSRFSRAQSLVFSLIPVAVILLGTEATLRLCRFRFDPEALAVSYSGSFAARMFQGHLESRHFVRDPVTFWAPKPSEPPFNSLGYRGEELDEEKAPGELRILAVGDSNTLGHEASWVNEMPAAVDAGRLGAERVTVVNAGVYGYTAYQGLAHLKRFLRYRPDVVIVSFGGNDASPNSLADKDFVPYVPHPVYAFFDHRVRILDLAEHLAFRWSLSSAPAPAPAEMVARVSIDDYESALAEMIALAREAGAAAVLATRPLAFDYRVEDSEEPAKPYYFSTRKVARRLDAGLVDVDAIANHSWVLFADHAHFNVEGHRFVGAAVADALTRILEGRSRVVSAPRFRPRNSYEMAADVAGRTLSRWRGRDDNLADLLRSPAVRGLTTVYRSDFTAGTGPWKITQRPKEPEDESPETAAGGLCFRPAPGRLSLVNEDLGLAGDRHHLVWIEASSTSDVALAVSWRSEGGRLTGEEEVQTVFYGGRTDVPIRYFRVVPAGARAIQVRADVLRREGDLCLREISVVEIDVAEKRVPRRSPPSGRGPGGGAQEADEPGR